MHWFTVLKVNILSEVSVLLWPLTVRSAAAESHWRRSVLVCGGNSPDCPVTTHNHQNTHVLIYYRTNDILLTHKHSCTFVINSVTMWSPLWRITPNNCTRFLWWRFLEKRILYLCICYRHTGGDGRGNALTSWPMSLRGRPEQLRHIWCSSQRLSDLRIRPRTRLKYHHERHISWSSCVMPHQTKYIFNHHVYMICLCISIYHLNNCNTADAFVICS